MDEDQPLHRSLRGDQRNDQAGKGVADQDQVIDPVEGFEHGLGKVGGSGRLVFQRQIHCRCVVATLLEF